MNRVVFFCVFAALALQQCLVTAPKPTELNSYLVVHKCSVSKAVQAIHAGVKTAEGPYKAENAAYDKMVSDRNKKLFSLNGMETNAEVSSYLTGKATRANPDDVRSLPTPAVDAPKVVTNYHKIDTEVDQLNNNIAAWKTDVNVQNKITTYTTAVADATIEKTKVRLAAATDDWIIHGLWPVTKDGSGNDLVKTTNVYADPSATVGIVTHWPNCFDPTDNDKFWKHEWTDHGVYNNGRTSAEYFKDTVDALVNNYPTIKTICEGAAASAVGKVLQNIIITDDGDCALVVTWDAGNKKYNLLSTAQYKF